MLDIQISRGILISGEGFDNMVDISSVVEEISIAGSSGAIRREDIVATSQINVWVCSDSKLVYHIADGAIEEFAQLCLLLLLVFVVRRQIVPAIFLNHRIDKVPIGLVGK